MDQEDIKTKIKSSTILSDSEKSEWFFLLPKMTEQQKQELLRILEVRMPSAPAAQVAPSPALRPTSPVQGEETPSPRAGEGRGEGTQLPHSAFNISPYGGSPVGRQNSELTVDAMRAAPSVYEFFDHLAASLAVKAKSREKTPEEAMADFQASPLYKAYVGAGKQMLSGLEPTEITRSEFEAIAEFRTSLKKVLQGT